tara:strand:+ start:138 stop:1970 length:1833 start_codon:yes stop_codon:yes gene_type:complete
MKKTIVSTFLFIIFLIFISISYLSFFGYETSRFNDLVKSEIKKTNKNINLEFDKISFFLDIKKFSLFVKFISPELNYKNSIISFNKLRTDIELKSILEKKLEIKRILLSTKFIELKNIKSILKELQINDQDIAKIKSSRLLIKNLELKFNDKLELKENLNIDAVIENTSLDISKNFKIINLNSNISYKNKIFYLKNASFKLDSTEYIKTKFFNGNLIFKEKDKSYDIDLNLKTKQISNLLNIPVLNLSFIQDKIATIKTSLKVKNNNVILKDLIIESKNNEIIIKNLLFKNYMDFLSFDEIKIKTSLKDKINNNFRIKNEKNKINIEGKVFDATNLIKQINNNKKNTVFKKFTKEIEVNLEKVLQAVNFPIRNLRLIGEINKGNFEKISAKSDFSQSEHLDISLKKKEGSNDKFLEIYSDIAVPLLTEYKFFKGLEGGNLYFESRFNDNLSISELTINNFKLNNAPTFAKILTLADLKGLTDTLKGEGISFDTLSIKYNSNKSIINVEEIFMIGPSVSVLVDGYVEKKSGLVSLRGTLVPAKQLNNLISKIPVIGNILVGKDIGEGIFGLSFKIKGPPTDLKTSVNPVKTLAPRFITRAIEAAKKKGSNQ